MPTGATVAALTTSLPETPGGERNWDYRYTWMRDTTFTLQALHYLNLEWEADEFMQFVADVEPNEDGSLQIMYGIDGRRDLTESTLDDLTGYAGARPVRIGNGAFDQRQNDVYGAVLDSFLLHTRRSKRLPRRLWPIIQAQAECATNGLAEPRPGDLGGARAPRSTTCRRSSCAGSRWTVRPSSPRSEAIPSCRRRGARPPRRSGRTSSSTASASAVSSASTTRPTRSTRRRSWRRSSGSCRRDDERLRKSVLAVAEELSEDGFVLRYRTEETDDGLSGEEGTFLICSFWLVSALAIVGEEQRAHDLMERLLRIASPLGLYAEEFDVKTGRHLGNFPQAFSHLALIEAAGADHPRRATGGDLVMDAYDVIIIGTGAGGGTLARHLAPSGKRILLLERGDWLPREPENWSTQDVFVDNRYVSPDTWYDASGKPFQPGVHYFVGGATKLYGAALYRLRKEDFGELQHHDGISPAWPISYDELEPYYTLAEQHYHVHGARGEDPTEPPASAPYPHPAVSHEPRIQQLADDLAAAGYRPFHAPCGIMLDESNPPFSTLHPLCHVRRLPMPRPCEVGRGGAGRAARARASERHAADEREGRQARHERRGHGRHRGRRRSGRRGGAIRGDVVVVAVRGGQHGQAAPAVGEREAPERPRQRLRPGRPQLHVPRLDGGPRALARGEPHRVPEDAGAQRLLLRLRRLRVPARERPDGRQVDGADVPRRAAAGDEARARVDARADGAARDRLLALDRGSPAARQPGDRRRRRQADVSPTRRRTRRRRSGCTRRSSRCSGSST